MAADGAAAPSQRRSLLSIRDLSAGELRSLVHRAVWLGRGGVDGRPALAGCSVATWFHSTSTRTRTAFGVGAQRLGASLLTYRNGDLQLNTGESLGDTGRVLGGMLDGLVARTPEPTDWLRELDAAGGDLSVVNAMTADEHPTQAVTDLATLVDHAGHLEELAVLYVGEGNSTAVALAYAMARVPGARLHLRTPPCYGLPPEVLRDASAAAAQHGAGIDHGHDLTALPPAVDAVYTTRWQTTGTSKADPNWRRSFEPYRADHALLARLPGAVFLHDLPAHRGEEVDGDVLDGAASVAFRQARYKLWGAMAVLEWCLAPGAAR